MSKVYEISGVKSEPGSPNDVVRCPDNEAEFYTLYQVFGAEHAAVGDFNTREEAEAWKTRMENLPDTPVDPAGKQLPPLPVENLNQFAQLMIDWHTNGQKQIALASNPPKDVRIKATIRGREKVLSIGERDAFIAGVQVAGEIFKNLPFQVVEEEIEQAIKGDTDA